MKTGKQLEQEITQRIRKNWSPVLHMHKREWAIGKFFIDAYYIGTLHTVYVDMNNYDYGKWKAKLELRINDIKYTRTYKRFFSERGLKAICARFIQDCAKLYEYD